MGYHRLGHKKGFISKYWSMMSFNFLNFQVGVIFKLMKKKVLEKLDQVEWISPDTKHSAIEKINKLDGKFIGSEMFFNYTLLQQRYHGVSTRNCFGFPLAYVEAFNAFS